MQANHGEAAEEARELLVGLMAIGRRVKARVSGPGHDPAAAFLLHHICTEPALRVSDLASSVGLDVSTVSRHVKRLEDAGDVARAGSPEDRRASLLQATPQGRDSLDRAMSARAAVVAAAIADWSEQDRRRLTELVTRLADALGQPGDPRPGEPSSSETPTDRAR